MPYSPSPSSVFIAAPGDGSSTETWLQNKQLIQPVPLVPSAQQVYEHRQGSPTLTSRQEPAKPPCPASCWFGGGGTSQAPSVLQRPWGLWQPLRWSGERREGAQGCQGPTPTSSSMLLQVELGLQLPTQTMVTPSLTRVQRGLDLTPHREHQGPDRQGSAIPAR